jgi:hypothetical protein
MAHRYFIITDQDDRAIVVIPPRESLPHLKQIIPTLMSKSHQKIASVRQEVVNV